MQNMVFGSFEQVEDNDNFGPVPAARYQLRLTKLEFKPLTSGPGARYALTFDIEGPNHQGRKIFDSWIVQHNNPQTVEIALRAIKQFAKAAGIMPQGDITAAFIESLEGATVDAHVKIENDKTGQYEPQNRVARYYPLEQAQGQAPQYQQAQAPQYQQAQAPQYQAQEQAGQAPAWQAQAQQGGQPWNNQQ